MFRKSKILFFLILMLTFSCTTIDLQRKVEPPFKSYVKVYHSIKILQCTEPFKSSCPIGEYVSMGSGMLVDFIENQQIIITAGHVCHSNVDKGKISLREFWSKLIKIIVAEKIIIVIASK